MKDWSSKLRLLSEAYFFWVLTVLGCIDKILQYISRRVAAAFVYGKMPGATALTQCSLEINGNRVSSSGLGGRFAVLGVPDPAHSFSYRSY